MEALLTLLIVWVLLACLVGWWAGEWGLSVGGYFTLALLLSPLIAGVVILISGNKTAREAADACKTRDQQREHERQLESLRAIAGSNRAADLAQPPKPSSVADELEKLTSLRQRGVLTEAELAEQKRRLLAS